MIKLRAISTVKYGLFREFLEANEDHDNLCKERGWATATFLVPVVGGGNGLSIRWITRWVVLLQGHQPRPAGLQVLLQLCHPTHHRAHSEKLSLRSPGDLLGHRHPGRCLRPQGRCRTKRPTRSRRPR